MKREHKELFEKVYPALQTKMSEFAFYEYNSITMDELWTYCVAKKWRKKQIADLPLYEIVSTIMSVSQSDIVSYGHVQESRTSDWFSELNEQELKLLLNPIKEV